jgi:hypothetical protein
MALAYAPLSFQFAFSLFACAARACPSACGAGCLKEWSNPDRILKQQVCAKFGPPDSDEVDPDPTPRPPEEGEGRFVLLTRSGTYNRIDGIAQGVDLIFVDHGSCTECRVVPPKTTPGSAIFSGTISGTKCDRLPAMRIGRRATKASSSTGGAAEAISMASPRFRRS